MTARYPVGALVALMVVLAAGACSEEPKELECPHGRVVPLDGEQYCVIEWGAGRFVSKEGCPAAYPYVFEFDGMLVCSDTPTMSEGAKTYFDERSGADNGAPDAVGGEDVEREPPDSTTDGSAEDTSGTDEDTSPAGADTSMTDQDTSMPDQDASTEDATQIEEDVAVPPELPCPGGVVKAHADLEYLFCPGPTGRAGAQATCAMIGATLATIETDALNTFLATTAKSVFAGQSTKCWFGATWSGDVWVWEDGSATSYTKFNEVFQPASETQQRGVLTLILNGPESENTDDYDGLWYAPPDASFGAGFVCGPPDDS